MSLDRFSTPDFINTLKFTTKLSAMILAVIEVGLGFPIQGILLD